MVLILINSYAGHLISYLSIPKMTPIPSSIEEVAYKTKTGLTVEAGSILADNIMVSFLHSNEWPLTDCIEKQNAKSGPYKAIADVIRSNPKLLFKAPGQVLEIIHDYNVPYIGVMNGQNDFSSPTDSIFN